MTNLVQNDNSKYVLIKRVPVTNIAISRCPTNADVIMLV